MMFSVNKQNAVNVFNLVNELIDMAFMIITTNKAPKQWTEILNDSVLTTAILDRIFYVVK